MKTIDRRPPKPYRDFPGIYADRIEAIRLSLDMQAEHARRGPRKEALAAVAALLGRAIRVLTAEPIRAKLEATPELLRRRAVVQAQKAAKSQPADAEDEKARFLRCFVESGGKVKAAARAAGIPPTRHYVWLRTDLEYAATYAAIPENVEAQS